MVAGMMAKPPSMPAEVPSFWGVYFAVDDADAAAAKITELGGQILMGPLDMPPGRLAAVQDSTGAVFNILKSARGR
jgi:predicted enzyme related to lactoylglutathione lyase